MLTLMALAVVWTAPAGAAEPRYSTWQNPAEAGQEWTQELQKLVDDAERARAADPAFLRDLRALLGKYSRPAGRPAAVELLVDHFKDGDFTQNPAWKVTAGKYWIEANYGLRSVIDPKAAQQQTSEGPKSKEELAAAVIGSVLGRALGGKSTTTTSKASAPAASATAAIEVAQKISNAFSMKLDISSWKTEGGLELGPTQGSGGYRLVYSPGVAPGLKLVRKSSRGDQVIGTYAAALNLEDRRNHAIEWDRTAGGQMSVKVDGKELITASDLAYRDAFDGFTLVNRGGDYVLASISVSGTR